MNARTNAHTYKAILNRSADVQRISNLASKRWAHSLPTTWNAHSSVLAWRIPGMGEPGRLQSMGSLRVGHDWATSLSLFTFMHWRRQWQPTPVFLPGESQGQGSLVGCRLWGRTESDTLKWLSSIAGKAFACWMEEGSKNWVTYNTLILNQVRSWSASSQLISWNMWAVQ